MKQFVIENKRFKLIINEDATAESLIFKPSGEECLYDKKRIPLFSVTEKRPFNNEIKLAYPNKRTTFCANRVIREGDVLRIGFELILFEAVVRIKERDDYISFELEDFIVKPEHFEGLSMDTPPVDEFRLLQIAVKKRTCFGQWLNVCFDENVAVNLLGVSPCERIDSTDEDDYYILTADAVSGIKLKGCEAALIVTSEDELLDCIETVENDYNLPKGVKSRRSPEINSSVYWSNDVNPENIDKHISYIKKMGFTKFLIYYEAILGDEPTYINIGEYKLNRHFPNGTADLKKMFDKLKSEGITPGFHFLHTHIGLNSPYLTPVADHRINMTRYFTLAKPLSEKDDIIYVEENPCGTVMHEKCRVLKFGGELIKYTGYSTEFPYFFYGCERGWNNTYIKNFDTGTIGGILDLSEYHAMSAYINQNSSLQTEIADKIADVYSAGFEFVYFDGSEGTNPPYEFHISDAQYKVYKKFDREPVFCEGAAKSHFGWHMLSGGNAFDVFPLEVFKEKIACFPADEAYKMSMDFTRVNFGWWSFLPVTQPDMYEYGTSLAAAWDSPVTVLSDFENFEKNPRSEDIFEILSRWEDVRRKKWLTKAQKDELKDTKKEHILLLNENNEYELAEYTEIAGAANGSSCFSAYVFERNGKTYVVCWHKSGDGELYIDIDADDFVYSDKIGGEPIVCKILDGKTVLPVSGRMYLSTDIPREKIKEIFEKALLK